ncbi:hypothetical protein Tco_0848857 [Tanacetum coccineum]
MASMKNILIQPLAMTTTNIFEVNHEDAYDSDVDEGPNAAAVFMANLSSTSATNDPVNEVHSNDNQIFDNVDYQIQEMHHEEHLDSDAETEIDDNTIPYHQYLLDTEAQNVPTEVSADASDKVSMIAILTDLQTQLDGHAKVNQEKCLEVETLKNELSQCKQEIYRLDTQKVKLDLENKVRQEQALVIQRNKRNAELVQENDLLKSTLSGKEKSIAFLQSEKEKIFSEKKDLADSYLDEIVCLKNANKVARDMLQRFNMPTQTIPMLSKKPKAATADLHKDLLGTRNPGLGYMAKRAQPVLYDADTILHPTHHPVSIWDSEDVLVHQVVSMKKMSEKPGHVRPENGFYDKLNALKFVPQQELSREQAYWLPANEIASQASKSATPATPFVRKSRPPSQVLTSLRNVNAVFPQFEGIIKERTTQKPDYVSEWCFDYAKQFVEQQLFQHHEGVECRFHEVSCDLKTIETEQNFSCKDTITSLRIQLDALKVENVSLKDVQSTFHLQKKQLGGTNPVPRRLQVTFQNLPGLQIDSTQYSTSASQQKAYVPVNLSDKIPKPATESHKNLCQSATLGTPSHSIVNHTKKVWKATRNHNVNTTKTAWRPTGKIVGSVKPQWKPTGRHFALYDNCPLTRIVEPIVEPLELTPDR